MSDKNLFKPIEIMFTNNGIFYLGIIRIDNLGTGSVGTTANLFLFQNVMRLMNV